MKEITNENYCQETLNLKQNIEESFLDLGERLFKIREKRLYEPSRESFDDFLMEMKMSSGTASKLINIYVKLVIGYQISVKQIASAGGWSIVAECLPIIKSREEAEEWIAKASFMTQTDIRRDIKEAMTGVQMKDCKHEWETYRFCHVCKLREKTYVKE